jgi:hypothetical protein
VCVVALVLDLKSRTRPSVRRKLLDGVTNGLSGVEKTAVPKSTPPVSCEQHRRRRVVELCHIASPLFDAAIIAESGEAVTGFESGVEFH